MKKVLIVESGNFVKGVLRQEFAKAALFELVFLSTLEKVQVYLQHYKDETHMALVSIGSKGVDCEAVIDSVIKASVPLIALTTTLSEKIMDKFASKPIIDYYYKNSMQDISYIVETVETLYYFSTRKALIVDDSQSMREHIAEYFRLMLFEPVFAGSAEEAIKILSNNDDIDIVTVDYVLPGMNGIELLQKIKTVFPLRKLNIIAMTANTDRTTISQFLRKGADDILTKPVIKDEFNTKILKILLYARKMDELSNYSHTMEQLVLASETNAYGVIRQASHSFSELSGYTKDELIGKPHNVIRHEDMKPEVFEDLWNTIKAGDVWQGEIKNKKKNGGFYWVTATVSPIYNYGTNELIGYRSIRKDITDRKLVEEAHKLLAEAQQKITDSIEFASLIQEAVLPDKKILQNYFDDAFVIWEPKDIVGGDIYQIVEYRGCVLVFVIDCTGHGVGGAFMTLIVKTVLESIINEQTYDDPALILKMLNATIKRLLNQYDGDSKSDAGLDGGVLFYDPVQSKMLYAGAKTPLYYISEGTMHTIKSDRMSIGYRKTDPDYMFTNHTIEVEGSLYIYITTDGYIDQNGGLHGYPYGKKNFLKELDNWHQEPFEKQKSELMKQLRTYQAHHERDDDITLVGFKLVASKTKETLKSLYIFDDKKHHASRNEIYHHVGKVTQELLGEIETRFESEFKKRFPVSIKYEKFLTVLFEVGQNLLHYSIVDVLEDDKYLYKTFLSIALEEKDDKIHFQSANIVNNDAKMRILERMDKLKRLNQDELKAFYKTARRDKLFSHDKGAGLGFFEILKRCHENFQVDMHRIDDQYSYYTLRLII